MPNANDILKSIAEHLGLNAEDLDRNALLQEELGLSSLELNDLLANLSHKFNVTFESDEIEHLSKVEDVISLVEDHLLDL